jgi:hypothetical protein
MRVLGSYYAFCYKETRLPTPVSEKGGLTTCSLRSSIFCFYRRFGNRGSSVSLPTDWTTWRSRFDSQQRQEIFPLTSVSRPALEPTQPPVQWVPGVLSPGVKHRWGVTLTTHPIYCRGQEWVGAIPYLLSPLRLHPCVVRLLYLFLQKVRFSVW